MFGKKKANPGGRLETDRFYVYYGLGTPEARNRLLGEPLVIVELRQWHPDDLHRLREGGTKIFGYLPVMESPSWDEDKINRLENRDYFLKGGQRVRFEKWDTFLMDLRSPSYRRLLFDELEDMHRQWPIDGIFLDTVGDIEEYVPDYAKEQMSEAYRAFLAVAASRYPQTKRIQNRGFSQLNACCDLLDGYLWEDWRSEWSTFSITKHQIKQLQKLNAERGLALLAVSPTASEDNRKSAHEQGFLHRAIDPSYLDFP
ncbi:glycoside hydrolase family 66 protein [Cohnella sp.]|uniref:glycoside hydrolase family 66 protein n=1 Tax=Cohnella sp. TaxID=1883426 RepID=UPI003563C993